MLVRGSEAAPLPLVRGLLLGAVPEAVYEESEVQLAAEDNLLMYTDGLIERRDRSVEESLTHLLTAAASAPDTLDQRPGPAAHVQQVGHGRRHLHRGPPGRLRRVPRSSGRAEA
ncbi:hypothetical protein GCM10023238_37360 [Streptomyces heliomycini]